MDKLVKLFIEISENQRKSEVLDKLVEEFYDIARKSEEKPHAKPQV